MEDSRIFLRKSIKRIMLKNSRRRTFGMNIDSLMIWLLMLLNQMVDSYGLARTTMVMFNPISLLKDTDP